MSIYLSLLVAIIALLIYVLSTNVKVVELARLAWLAGLGAFLIRVAELPNVMKG